jgi:tetratricopeptide (TPR) repeat protein
MAMARNGRSRALNAVALLFLVLTVPALCWASEQSILISSEGLEAFHSERYADALPQFDRAVAADPSDVTALYYQAVTLGRLGEHQRAERALLHLLELRPDCAQAFLELGIVLLHTGHDDRYPDAIKWLTRAQQTPEIEATASFYLGVTYLRVRRFPEALANFGRAERDPTLGLAVRFYKGRVHYEAHEWPEADEDFAAVVAASPDSDMGREAERFRAAIREQGGQPYSAHGSVGFEYDSNVLLAPSSEGAKDVLAISHQADGRAVFLLGGSYMPWRTEHARLSLGYEFYQSVQFQLSDFNLQDHRPSIDVDFDCEPIEGGVSGRYDYYRLGNDSFLNQETALPWLRVREGGYGYTEAYYRMRRRDFFEHRFSAPLDGYNHAIAVDQTVFLGAPERFAWIGYRFDQQGSSHSQGDMFAYDGHQAEGGLGWLWPRPEITATLAYHYRHESYDDASNGRRDEEHALTFGVQRAFGEHMDLRLGYAGTFNNSNQTIYEYTRHIGTIAFDVSF